MVRSLEMTEVPRELLNEQMHRLVDEAFSNQSDPVQHALWTEYMQLATALVDDVLALYEKVILEGTRIEKAHVTFRNNNNDHDVELYSLNPSRLPPQHFTNGSPNMLDDSRRQSTRNRLTAARSLEALVNGFFYSKHNPEEVCISSLRHRGLSSNVVILEESETGLIYVRKIITFDKLHTCQLSAFYNKR
ncbi:hypothetical protein POM88_010847 [Heracleum sosnowskyi]|uniref:Uncharacterized protein n=1 Tax=Heracleum sosnowskyi TaxID=360622 RepID=A0AAD8IUG9_9APIA|nr:hypothetical protein POM88_010847 [Heracleum sosnowskyi]